MSEIKLSASLVLFKNNPQTIYKLLDCIKSSTLPVDLYCIDNSPSNELETIVKHYGYRYYSTPENPGFGCAHNHALSLCGHSDIHLIINPDITFDKYCIEQLVTRLTSDPGIVCVTPRITYPDGRLQRLCKLLPTPANLIFRRFFPFMAKSLDYQYELQWFHYDKTIAYPSASGCFMVIKTDTLKKIGGFDENFFMYLEDIDLSRRLLAHGEIIFEPAARVVHEFAKASFKSKKLLWIHVRSAIYYFNKWGWFFDVQRHQINKSTINAIRRCLSK